MMTPHRLSGAALCFAALLFATPALAQNDPIVEDLIERGTADYKEGRFDQALNRFKAAYERDKGQPDLLYNIARTYEGLKNFDEAIAYYDQFLQEPDANTEARRDAAKRLEVLRSIVAARQKEDLPSQPDSTTPPNQVGDVTQPKSVSPTTDTPEPQFEEDEGGIPLASWILFGVGAAGIGSGVVFTVLHSSNVSDVEDACNKVGDDYACPVGAQDDVDSMNQNALIADISYGVGAAALVTGAIIAIAGSGSDSDESASRVIVTPTRDGGGYVGLHASF